jgi:hypothetical protein
MGWVRNTTPRPLYPRGTDPISTLQEAGWTPRPVWVGAENLAPTGIRFSDPLARNKPVAVQTALPAPTKINKYWEDFDAYFLRALL